MAELNYAEKMNIGYENEYSTDAMTGGPDKRRQLYYQLIQSMKKAESVDIIVSFLMESGVKMLLQELENTLKRGAKIRILTGNYLGITQPSALYLIKRKLGDRVDLRFYCEKGRSFHPKSYIFHYADHSELYIGSSNISRSALTSGIEWNYRFSSKKDPENYAEFFYTFEDLFENHSIIIDDKELKRYSQNWHRPAVAKDLDKYDFEQDTEDTKIKTMYEPRGAQIEALCALEDTRAEGAKKALIQAATGIGKTYCQAEIHINEDSTTDEIAQDLANLGIINMPDVFKLYTKMFGKGDKFIKGTFTVDTTMSYSALISELQTVSTVNQTVSIQITEGMTIDEIAQMMEDNRVCRAEDFMEQCKTLGDTYKFQKRLENKKLKYYQMEGYIFPDTYEFYILPALEDNKELDTSEYAADALDIIYQNFNNKLTARYYNRMSELGLTLDETITLASIAQREADTTTNMGNVASVFFNRMADAEAFPHLESDVTVHYVDEHIKPHLTSSQYDQKMFDAYNTYKCDGIPIGPICNPGLDAIKAVLYAPETSYYYFCADPDTTEMYFAETISEHEENLRKCGLDHAIAE